MKKTPKLRFKEFSGDWESKKLGGLLEFKNGINASKEQYGHGKKFINVLDILSNNYITYENIIGKVDIDDDTFKKYSVGYGDVVFQRSSETREEVGTANVYLEKEHKATFGGFIIRGKKIGEYDPVFMNKLLKTSSARKEITTKSGGSTRYNVGQEILAGVEVMFPKLEEQEKIAYFFSLIDDKISLQGEKVEALKDYKKGMMQKIFSRELRFNDEDWKDYPEWDVTTVEKVANLEKGFTPDTKNERNWIGDTPWLSIADMKQGKYVSDVSKYISDEALGKKQLVPEGTLIMSFKLTLGRLAIINSAMMTNEAICHFYWKNKNINTEYMYYYLSTANIESFGCRAAKGITLNNDSLNSIVVKLPLIEEQNKIADILMKIDDKLQKEQDKLDSLNEYKKGLLQQMFV